METPTDDDVTPRILGHTTPKSSKAQLSFLIDANDGWHHLRGEKKLWWYDIWYLRLFETTKKHYLWNEVLLFFHVPFMSTILKRGELMTYHDTFFLIDVFLMYRIVSQCANKRLCFVMTTYVSNVWNMIWTLHSYPSNFVITLGKIEAQNDVIILLANRTFRKDYVYYLHLG